MTVVNPEQAFAIIGKQHVELQILREQLAEARRENIELARQNEILSGAAKAKAEAEANGQ